eukprot:NODE_16086_length_1013_cov_2.767494.p2 GENE.NODE_16086_length_1013_cov_2.767494~~NODE_16086_length_1013_cov_2.767494.p2  ORF type:complete len:170 (-),score=35.08 NODE_16086_length_1013_cov_2.767494:402-911(-)
MRAARLAARHTTAAAFAPRACGVLPLTSAGALAQQRRGMPVPPKINPGTLASPFLPEVDVPKLRVFEMKGEANEGWVVLYTQDNRQYFHNAKLDITQWENPVTGSIMPSANPTVIPKGPRPLPVKIARGTVFAAVGVIIVLMLGPLPRVVSLLSGKADTWGVYQPPHNK